MRILVREAPKKRNNNNNHLHPRDTPLPPDKGLLSMSASSPNSWGEFIISRVPCSPHTQLSRPLPWGHHILESRRTQNTQHVCHAHRWCTVHREMLHRMLVGPRVYTRQHKCMRFASVLKRDSHMSNNYKNHVDAPKVALAKWVAILGK